MFMLNIVLRAFDRSSERSIGLHDCIEEGTIAGVLIVGMVAPSKITKHPLYTSLDALTPHLLLGEPLGGGSALTVDQE